MFTLCQLFNAFSFKALKIICLTMLFSIGKVYLLMAPKIKPYDSHSHLLTKLWHE